MLNSQEYIIERGRGDIDIAVAGLAGTIMMQVIQGWKVPDVDVCINVLREAILRLHDEYRDRLGTVMLIPEVTPFDSAKAGFSGRYSFAESIADLRHIQETYATHAIAVAYGSTTFDRFQAAVFQGMPKDAGTVIASACAMRHADSDTFTDAFISMRNMLELCLDPQMVDDSKEKKRGKCAAVVNAGDFAYPAGFLRKVNTTFQGFSSRSNRIGHRTTRFSERLKHATDGGIHSYSEDKMWARTDEWIYERPTRSSDFPQGDGTRDFSLLGGIKYISLHPENRYESMLREVILADPELHLPPGERERNAFLCIAPGEGTLRDDGRSLKLIEFAANEAAARSIPFFVGSEAFDKQLPPQGETGKADYVYPGDPSLFGGNVVSVNGLENAERSILIGRVLAEAHALGKKDNEFLVYVQQQVEEYKKKWK